MGLEELLNDAGGLGRFQIVNLFIFYLGKLFSGWSMFQMTFAGIVPDFLCERSTSDDVLDLEALSLNLTSNRCYIPLNASDLSLGKIECVAYNYTSPYKTVMKDFDLVCGRDWIKPTLISIQMAGLMLGSIVAGQLGDVLGRWKSNLIFVIILCLGNMAAAFSPGWEVFAVFRCVIGVGIGGIMVVSFTQPIEFMPKKWRPVVSCTPAWALGVTIFSFTAYLLQDWRKMHFVTGASGILQIPLLFLVPESLRWLATQGRIDQAEVVIDKVAKWNGKPPVPHARATLEDVYSEQKQAEEKSQRYTYMSILRPWSTAKITLIMFYHWFCYSLSYYGISFGVSDLAGNFFLNVLLLGLIDTPPLLLTLYTNNKIGRKWTALIFIIVAVSGAVACMTIIFTGEGGKGSVMVTTLSLIARTGVSVSWYVMQTWGNELYPTVIRNLGYGAANTTARVAGILAPFIIDFKTRMTESYVLIVVLLAIDLVLILLLSDTKGITLSDTIAGAKGKEPEVNEKSGQELKSVANIKAKSSGVRMKEKSSEKFADTKGSLDIQNEIKGLNNQEKGYQYGESGFTDIRL
ncbi:solute carrier family 22 member 21 [Elysia marginata]|uniref:Solute carrier family 22 member 21 n=1 Tax=Elysia marginata TaxID=1093978 RepID=A0AAV4FJY0_9GAST|nr:solute carrier family 22 member 21 [Elysia marginata]